METVAGMLKRARHIRIIPSAAELSRELQDQADELMKMAVAEAGYPIESKWDEASHRHFMYPLNEYPPPDVWMKAAVLVCDRLGIPYRYLDEGERNDNYE